MKEKFDSNAYSQAYSIVEFLLENGEIVVSEQLLQNLKDKRNPNYKFNLNDLKSVELNTDTEKILTLVYYECFATKEDKNKIIKATKLLRKVIVNDDEELYTENKNAFPLDLNSLKWIDKIRLKMKKIMSLKMKVEKD